MKCGIKPKESNIVLAAFMGRQPYVVYLMDEVQIPIDSVDMYSRTALHRACEGTKVQLFKWVFALIFVDYGGVIINYTIVNHNK